MPSEGKPCAPHLHIEMNDNWLFRKHFIVIAPEAESFLYCVTKEELSNVNNIS